MGCHFQRSASEINKTLLAVEIIMTSIPGHHFLEHAMQLNVTSVPGRNNRIASVLVSIPRRVSTLGDECSDKYTSGIPSEPSAYRNLTMLSKTLS